MAEYRALLTDREREILSGQADVEMNYVYQVRSRVRSKIDRLMEDIRILDEHHPELLQKIEEIVCGSD